MFGLGFGEILIVLVLALVLLGPERLPDAAKQLGKGLREFKKATSEIKQQVEKELYSDEKHLPLSASPMRLPTPSATAAPSSAEPDATVTAAASPAALSARTDEPA
jgi:sec-independent protein translocase protein TatB